MSRRHHAKLRHAAAAALSALTAGDLRRISKRGAQGLFGLGLALWRPGQLRFSAPSKIVNRKS